ncbi:hypothetical protein SDC9_99590 [bioreactor metagenome]|uniref:Uncharacterized protein n=1 Tax=bioreactor metagenome TaxID=1076179 RepID=A0A645AII9_9ZZZZ
MVNDQIHRYVWIDDCGVFTQFIGHITQSRQVHDCRSACQILQNDTGWFEGDLRFHLIEGFPISQGQDVLFRDDLAVFLSQQVFQQDTDGVRQFRDRHLSIFQ